LLTDHFAGAVLLVEPRIISLLFSDSARESILVVKRKLASPAGRGVLA
jgi:hypothetical protein